VGDFYVWNLVMSTIALYNGIHVKIIKEFANNIKIIYKKR